MKSLPAYAHSAEREHTLLRPGQRPNFFGLAFDLHGLVGFRQTSVQGDPVIYVFFFFFVVYFSPQITN